MTNKSTLLSGITLSGHLHIGHHIGAMKQWLAMQNEYQAYYMLADMHAITVKQDPILLRQRCYETAAIYIACGIDPNKSVIFVQSQVPQHAQLTWALNCFTYMGELNRMTQFKDKSQKQEANINAGLFDYPVLMASDILLYQAKAVPVGEDQKQHIELTRDIAMRFNNLYGEIFTIPEPFIPKMGARIMSLQNPEQKMSKSDPNENSYIALLDAPDTIRQKLKRAVTDSGKEVYYDDNKPGIANLLILLSSVTQQPIATLEQEYRDKGYGTFKNAVAEAVIEFLAPIQQRYHELRRDDHELNKILLKGAKLAQQQAQQTLKNVYEAIGFVVSQE